MKKLILRRSNFKIGYFTDTVILIFSFFGSYALRYNTLSGIFAKKQILLFSFLMISWICIIYFIKLYKDDYRKLELNFSLSRLLLALLLQLALLSIFWIVTHEISYSRLRSFNYFSLFFALGFTYRYIVITSLRYLSRKNLQVTGVEPGFPIQISAILPFDHIYRPLADLGNLMIYILKNLVCIF